MSNTITLARLYEDQGHKNDALGIYQEILKQDPTNKEVIEAIARLTGHRKEFLGVDKKKLNYFIKMTKEEDFLKFERWLAKWN
ncbi:MAG: hypothetical protein OIF32_09390 [Campylobacterales bacterium]|nr:hypothetical protein [Campylobacterales bacterium]